MIDKKAFLGSGVLMVYRLVMVTIVALIILGLSATFYQYHIDVRESEIMIFARQAMDCVSPDGIFDLDSISNSSSGTLLEYCGFGEVNGIYIISRFYNSSGILIKEFKEGEEPIKEIYRLFAYSDRESTESIKKYRPDVIYVGSRNFPYGPINILHNETKVSGWLVLEVYSNGEF
jgi:hypothetical protein